MTWVKGESGNKAGKPIGTISRTVKLRNMIADRIPEVIDTLINAAMAGDIQAAKVLLERVLPAIKSESLPVNLNLPEKFNLVDIGNKIIGAIGNGEMSPDQGVQVLQALTGQAKLVEVTELEQRIKALEEANNVKHKS